MIELDLTSKQALVILVLVVCKEGMPQAMSRQSTISREIDLERSQFYTILIISAGIYNEDTVRYFFMPGNIFFTKTSNKEPYSWELASHTWEATFPQALSRPATFPSQSNMAFVMLCPVAMVLQFDGVMVAIAFCSAFQAKIRGK